MNEPSVEMVFSDIPFNFESKEPSLFFANLNIDTGVNTSQFSIINTTLEDDITYNSLPSEPTHKVNLALYSKLKNQNSESFMKIRFYYWIKRTLFKLKFGGKSCQY